jgi:hypothetical protein
MSLLINEAYASPSTPLWASTINPVFSGVVYASEFQTTGGGDIVLKDLSGNTALRLATGAITPSPAYLQTSTSLYFGQVGQSAVNTTFTPSAPNANADLFSIGGAIILKDISGNTSGRFDCPSVSNVAIQASNAILFQQVGGLTGNSSLQVKAAGQQDIFTTGVINADSLFITKTGSNASVGIGNLTNGTATITVPLSDVTANIFVTRTAINSSTAIGHLRVSSQNASNFTVVSAQAASPTTTESGDQSTFNWWIINGVA